VAFLAYWPVAFLRGSPTTLILVAAAGNILIFALLAATLARRVAADRITALLCGLTAAQLAVAFASLRYSLFSIHADAPALAGAALGTGLLVHGGGALSWRRCLVAASAFALGVWAKQSLAPIFAAGLALAAWRGGRPSALRFAAASAIAGLVLSFAFAAWLGWSNLRDNMLVVPARHPWHQMNLATGEIFPTVNATGLATRAKVVVAAALHLVRESWLVFSVLLAALAEFFRNRAPGAPRWPRRVWAGYFLVALAMFPTSAIGRTKVGGEVNHESFVVFFLVAALVAWLAEEAPRATGRLALRLATVLGVLSLVNAPRALEYRGWSAAWDNQNEQAYRYELRHPHAVYFPWNPLTSLLADGQLYHFDYGVFDRNLGGARVSPAHLAEHLPEPRPVIASYLAHHDYILHEYFPDYRERPALPELPGWRIYGPPPAEAVNKK
jgi:hypothetical protein